MTYNVSGYSSWVRNTSSPSDRPGEVFSSPFGFIGAGQCNCIDTTLEAGSCYGVIGGGLANIVCAGTRYSSVLNGYSNTNSGSYSAILGGANNVIPAGCQYVATFGNAVTACINNALHLENLWMKPGAYCHYPGYPAVGLPSGTVFVDTSTNNTLRVQP